jgi:type IV pilus assembly protein PilM
MSPETMQFQFFDAGEVRQGEELREEIILVAAQKAVVEEHLSLLLRCGLRPAAIDVVPGALARGVGAPKDAEVDAPARVVLDVGYSSSKVLIVHHGRVIFFKLIDIGGQRLDQMVAQSLSLPEAEAADLRRQLQRLAGGSGGEGAAGEALFGSARREAIERAVFDAVRASAGDLTKEVSLCLRYYSVTFRGRRPEKLLLVGGEAREAQLAKALGEGAGIEVELADPAGGVDMAAVSPQGQPGGLSEWAVAIGLALRGDLRQSKRSAA